MTKIPFFSKTNLFFLWCNFSFLSCESINQNPEFQENNVTSLKQDPLTNTEKPIHKNFVSQTNSKNEQSILLLSILLFVFDIFLTILFSHFFITTKTDPDYLFFVVCFVLFPLFFFFIKFLIYAHKNNFFFIILFSIGKSVLLFFCFCIFHKFDTKKIMKKDFLCIILLFFIFSVLESIFFFLGIKFFNMTGEIFGLILTGEIFGLISFIFCFCSLVCFFFSAFLSSKLFEEFDRQTQKKLFFSEISKTHIYNIEIKAFLLIILFSLIFFSLLNFFPLCILLSDNPTKINNILFILNIVLFFVCFALVIFVSIQL